MDQSFFTGRISQLGTRVEPEQSKQSESKDETQQSHQSHSGVGQGPAGMASDSSFSLCLLVPLLPKNLKAFNPSREKFCKIPKLRFKEE